MPPTDVRSHDDLAKLKQYVREREHVTDGVSTGSGTG
jgi:hypothetical protein